MSYSGSETYDADVATTFAMFCDEEATLGRYEGAGNSDVEILECGSDGDGFVIRSQRVVTVDLPGFAKKVLKPTNTMVQTDRWEADAAGERRGTYEVEVKGSPVTVRGTMALASAGADSCRHEITGEIEVKVPLVGKRIAKWAEGDAATRMQQEFAYNKRRLSAPD